ncbi:hypothetical protein NMY22_g15697 [Coprinellus aureogranulatus]|nr:hypothetical protein NMY22_g15697 [Coprinellus aureogranulatus]
MCAHGRLEALNEFIAAEPSLLAQTQEDIKRLQASSVEGGRCGREGAFSISPVRSGNVELTMNGSARNCVIDPVFVRFPLPLSLMDDEELGGIGALSAGSIGGKGYKGSGGLSLPKAKQSVYVREEVEDESLEVDMSMDVDAEGDDTTTSKPGFAALQAKSVTEWIDAVQPMDVVDEHPPLPLPPTKKARTRPSPPARSSARRSAQKDIPASTATSGSSRRNKRRGARNKHEEDEDGDNDYAPSTSSTSPPYPLTGGKPLASLTSGPSTPTMGGNSVEALGLLSSSGGIANGKMKSKGRGKAGEKGKGGREEQGRGRGVKTVKPKPETYKQACSVEGQHPLEQLLEEIPEGVGFRFVLLAFFVSFPAQYLFVRTSFSFLFVSPCRFVFLTPVPIGSAWNDSLSFRRRVCGLFRL